MLISVVCWKAELFIVMEKWVVSHNDANDASVTEQWALITSRLKGNNSIALFIFYFYAILTLAFFYYFVPLRKINARYYELLSWKHIECIRARSIFQIKNRHPINLSMCTRIFHVGKIAISRRQNAFAKSISDIRGNDKLSIGGEKGKEKWKWAKSWNIARTGFYIREGKEENENKEVYCYVECVT